MAVLGEHHIRTARAFGLPERRIVFRYALRLAVLPTVALLGVAVGHLLSGAVFAELVFVRPGIGKLVSDAVLTRNYPVVSGTALVAVAIAVVLGGVLGLMAGYGPRALDNLIVLVFDTVRSFPTVMFALALTTLIGPSLETVVTVVIASFAPGYGRIVRTQTQ